MTLAKWRWSASVLALTCLLVYLFVSAPPPLTDAQPLESGSVTVESLLELCDRENAIVRELYTRDIVGAGKAAGLKFDEDWTNPALQAGPLPALFLRATAAELAKDAAPLGLFLGSDFPISQANRFSGATAEAFAQVRKDGEPRHFYMPDVQLHAAMYPDIASAPACVDCHNQHAHSAKRDWKLGDIMGGTTWTYPHATVSKAQALGAVRALRRSVHHVYTRYVESSRAFTTPPSIGSQWPSNGNILPTPQVFMAEASRRSSPATLSALLEAP
jgi:adenylate cyclase